MMSFALWMLRVDGQALFVSLPTLLHSSSRTSHAQIKDHQHEIFVTTYAQDGINE